MMTLVITALASVVLTWGLGSISSSRAALTGAVNARINRVQEGLVVEDVQLLDATHLRVWVRNTGAIQIVIDQAYVNNAQSSVVGVCSPGTSPPGTTQTASPGVLTGATSLAVTLSPAEPNTNYVVFVKPSWTTTYTISAQATTGFTINFGTAAPSGASLTWTASPLCPAGTKLSLAIQAIGSYDVLVPSVASSCTGGPVCSGSSYAVTSSTTRGTTFQNSFTV